MLDSNLELSLLKPEEAETYMRIRHLVFADSVNNILYPRSPASRATLDKVTADIADGIQKKGVLYLKVTDKSTGEVIAGAKWRYVQPKREGAKERTWVEVEEGFRYPFPVFEESEPALTQALQQLFNKHKWDILGTKPYYVLDTCVTLPQHERRGAGSMLVKWGCDRADEAGVVAYLEASLVGAPMYARQGFVVQRTIELDLGKYGGKQEVMEFQPMLRQPRVSQA